MKSSIVSCLSLALETISSTSKDIAQIVLGTGALLPCRLPISITKPRLLVPAGTSWHILSKND